MSAASHGKQSEDIIILDDDEMGDDKKSTEVENTRNCINILCKSGLNLLDPPALCLTYYHIRGKAKEQKVCQECFQNAIDHFSSIENAIEDGKSLLSLNYPSFTEIVRLDSDDDSSDTEEVQLDDKTAKFLEDNLQMVLDEVDHKFDLQGVLNKTLKEVREKVDKTEEATQKLQADLKETRNNFDRILYSLAKVVGVEHSQLPELIIDHEEHFVKPMEEDPDDLEEVGVQVLRPPDDLPPRGQLVRPTLTIGGYYYIRRNDLICWMKVKLENIIPPGSKINDICIRTYMYQVHRDIGGREQRRFVEGRNLAYSEVLPTLLEIGTRVIALSSNNYYPGIVGEFPSAFNKFRYLIFFDDGYALYVHYKDVFLIYAASDEVWKDVYPESQAFIKKYLMEYPNRSMVKFQKEQEVRTEFKGKWYDTVVKEVDCSLVKMYFPNNKRSEWIYRGSRRLKTMYQEQAASNRLHKQQKFPRARNRPIQSLTWQAPEEKGAPYVQYSYMRDNDVEFVSQQTFKKPEQREVARKSTRPTVPSLVPPVSRPAVQREKLPPGKIVYYTPRKPYSFYHFQTHTCKPECLNNVPPLSRLKGYGPLAKPLLSGFYRMLYKAKHRRAFILYKTPCGRTTRNMEELHYYLTITNSELSVDLFDFDPTVRCLAEFILERDACINKDLSDGQEQVAVPVVNYVDDKVCNFLSYCTQRMPLEGVNLNLDPEFLICCDCEDDCADKSKCACWQLTQEGAKHLGRSPDEIGYVYRRLLEPLHTGIYECNSRCKCRRTCLNRVVQNPLQHKLQVFMTSNNRGWGIRCLNDIPQGSFICIYAGSLMTDEMANEGDGDEYYAELDFIEVVESTKSDYEEEAYQSDDDAQEARKEKNVKANPSAPPPQPQIAQQPSIKNDVPVEEQSATQGSLDNSIRSRLRKRDVEINYKKMDEETFNLSDEETPAREPGAFNPDGDMEEPGLKYTSLRTLFGKDETVYIMDAKSKGNLGRFLNHSCSPNVFVQNVFVDTHDLRFPWVSFFAMQFIRAGTELTWNYNYEIGSVQDKIMYCNCGSIECKGRLL